MERAGHSTADSGSNCEGSGTPRRGRGRARGRARLQSENTSGPGLTNDVHHQISPTKINLSSSGQPGQFEDAVANMSVSDDQNRHKMKSKENSASPVPQRSRKSMFDSGIMSRINSHLQESVRERTGGGITRSLDRIKETSGSGTSCVSRLASPNLRLNIPANPATPHSQHTDDLRNKLIAAGRPRSMTDPVPPAPGRDEETRKDVQGASRIKEPGQPQLTSDCHTQSQSSGTASSASVSRLRGRGRARGRAQNKHREMEGSTRPGTAPCDGQDSQHTMSKGKDITHDKFNDAVASSVSHDANHSNGSNQCAPVSDVSLPSSSGTQYPSSSQVTSSDSQITSAGESTSQKNGANGGLVLKMATGGAQDPDQFSPLADDITMLLSPNHEFTLDWAAAMATPTPDTSSDSAPDWNV